MKYLFDSSAIFSAIKENQVEVLTGNYTLELARYELGNILWKGSFLHSKISEQESKLLAKTVKHSLAIMDIIGIAGSEEEILETATHLKITFYDASYAYFARAKQLRLITEDSQLIKKITPAISAATIAQIT